MDPSATRVIDAAGDWALAERWPFVGRRGELAALGRLLAVGGAVKGAVVCGPAGVGKSRLARQAAAQYKSAVGAPWFLRGSDARPTAISLLSGLAGSQAPPSGGAPRLLVLDDADLLDDASALVLEQWVSADRIRLLATLRAGARLPDTLGALLASGLLSRVDLAPLDEHDVAELLAAALGGDVSPGTVREIQRLSAGNSLFIRELLLDAASAGTLRRADDGVWRLDRIAARSDRLADLLDARLAGVSGPQRAALELVALAPGVGLRLLLGLVEPPVVEALERQGLIEVDREDRRLPTRVCHPLYRELIARSTPVSARLAAARRLADALEATGLRRAEDLVRWAVWRLDGGGTPDRAKMAAAARYAAAVRAEAGVRERLATAAFEHGREVGDGLLLYEAMVDAGRFEAAHTLLDSLDELAASDQDRAALAAAHATRISWTTGRLDQGLTILEEASHTISQPRAAAWLAAHHGMLLAVAGRFDDAIGELEPQLHAPWPQVRSLAAAGAAMAYPLVGSFRAGLRAFDLAMADRAQFGLAVADGAQFELAVADRAQFDLAVADRARFELATADRARFDLATADHAQHDAVGGAAPSLAALAARALCDYGEPAAALDRARAAIEDTLDRGDVVGQAWARAGLASVSLCAGDLPAAATQAAEAARLFEEAPHDPNGRLWCLATGLSAASQRGDRAQARRLAEVLTALPVPPQLRALGTEVVRAWSWHDCAIGESDAAGERLAQAADAWADDGMVVPAVLGALDLFRLGHLGPATRLLDRIALPDDWPLGACIRQLLDAAGKPSALREAAEALHALGFTLYAAEAYASAALTSGELRVMGTGDAGRAATGVVRTSGTGTGDTSRAATDVVRTSGMGTGSGAVTGTVTGAATGIGRASRAASRALTLAAECDARTPLLRHLGPLRALTPRERQIAEHAADGLSNRQIALQLRLSERTVENHLGRIYDKLGVAGRSELAEALHRARRP